MITRLTQVDTSELTSFERAARLIAAERERQDAKWGQQNHDPATWLLILTEELGEVSKARLEHKPADYILELIQSAAVIVAWLECEVRKVDAPNDHA